MKHLLLVFACLSFMLSSRPLHASHIAAADLSYECLGNDNYEFTLRLYRDCQGISIPLNYNVEIAGLGSCISNTTLIRLAKVSEVELPILCSDSSVVSACARVSPNSGLGYQEIIYKTRVNLRAFQDCNWIASWDECCRNNSITTISSAPPIYIYTSFIDSTVVCNNSPTINNTPVFIVCDSNLQDISNTMIDIDGDSLVYSLVSPLQGYQQPITCLLYTSPSPRDRG